MITPFKNLMRFAVLLALPLAFVACGDDDDTMVMEPAAPTTIASVASGDDRFETLVTALTNADLVSVLSNPAEQFTVFAPTDDAFAQVDLSGFSDETVRAVLLYHVLGGEVKAADIADGTSFIGNGNTLGPDGTEVTLVVNKSADGVSVNDASVIDADLDADNGVIHAIDKVLLPPTVVDIAVAFPGTSSLVSALLAADASPDYDLVSTLSGTGPFTVFAPTNDVFMVDGSATADQIGAILAYHVIPGNVRAEDLPDGETLMVATVNGAMLSVTRNGDAVTLVDGQGNSFSVTTPNVQGANGVIHTISGVMMP